MFLFVENHKYIFKKNDVLLVVLFNDIILSPELSSQTCFRIQGREARASYMKDGGRKSLCLISDGTDGHHVGLLDWIDKGNILAGLN